MEPHSCANVCVHAMSTELDEVARFLTVRWLFLRALVLVHVSLATANFLFARVLACLTSCQVQLRVEEPQA